MGTVHCHFMVPVDDGIEDVQREPANRKCHHNGKEHDVYPFTLTATVFVFTHSVHHVITPLQTSVDLSGREEGDKQSFIHFSYKGASAIMNNSGPLDS